MSTPVLKPLLKPLLIIIGASSMLFFGGVIALTLQSNEAAGSASTWVQSASSLLNSEKPEVPKASEFSPVLRSITPTAAQATAIQQTPMATLTAQQAADYAQRHLPNTKILAVPELVNYQGTVAYEVRLDSGLAYIDANFGELLNPATKVMNTTASISQRISNDGGYEDDEDEYDDEKGEYHDEYKEDKHHDEDHKDKKHKKHDSRLIVTDDHDNDEDYHHSEALQGDS